MTKPVFLAAGAISLAAFVAGTAAASPPATVRVPDRTCNVRDFGAKASIIWYDTEAFQKAIDSCAASGGGTVEVPRGEYLVGPLFLASNIRLNLQARAEIVGGTDPALFRLTEAIRKYASSPSYVALINVRDAHNVAITGPGTIDGQGAVWWERTREGWRNDQEAAKNGAIRQSRGVDRPRLILITNAQNVLIDGVHLANSPAYNIVFKNSDDVAVTHVTISAPPHSPNTDAIDPMDTRNVLIAYNTISCGDDVVAIKSTRFDPGHPDAVSANITITDNNFLEGRGISIGSNTNGGVKHVLVENNKMSGAMYGVRIKTMRGKGGEVSDVVIRNNSFTGVETPFVFSDYYQQRPSDIAEARRQMQKGGFILNDQIYPNDADPSQPFERNKTPDIHDITVDGFTATGADRVGIIVGLPEAPIRNLVLRNMKVDADTGLVVRNASVTRSDVSLAVKSGAPVSLEAGAKLSDRP